MSAAIPTPVRLALAEQRKRALDAVAALEAVTESLRLDQHAIEAAVERLRDQRVRTALAAQNAEAAALRHVNGLASALADAAAALSLDAPPPAPVSAAPEPVVYLPKPANVLPIGAVPLAPAPSGKVACFNSDHTLNDVGRQVLAEQFPVAGGDAPPDEDGEDDEEFDLGGEGVEREWPEGDLLPHPADVLPPGPTDESVELAAPEPKPTLAASSERIAANGKADPLLGVAAAANAPEKPKGRDRRGRKNPRP